jgi:hypothetical protein
VRIDGEWFFKYRDFNRWYIVDALERPVHGGGVAPGTAGMPTGQLPDRCETWDSFWAEVAADADD